MPIGPIQARMNYLFETMTLKRIAHESQIPRIDLYRLNRYGTALPQEHRGKFQSYYQKRVYEGLTIKGMSQSQAMRFSWSAPDTVKDVSRRMTILVDYLSDGVYLNLRARAERDGEIWDEQDLRRRAREAILEGLENSNKNVEDWERYVEPSR